MIKVQVGEIPQAFGALCLVSSARRKKALMWAGALGSREGLRCGAGLDCKLRSMESDLTASRNAAKVISQQTVQLGQQSKGATQSLNPDMRPVTVSL